MAEPAKAKSKLKLRKDAKPFVPSAPASVPVAVAVPVPEELVQIDGPWSPSAAVKAIPGAVIGAREAAEATIASGAAIYSIDVECAATDVSHNARTPIHIAVVDGNEDVVLDVIVKPEQKVVSYLTALTGVTEESVEARGMPLQDAVALIRKAMPSDAVLVGQAIHKDVQWLDLEHGKDFKSAVDLASLFRVLHPKFNTWSGFSLHHEASCLLGEGQEQQHDAVNDARLSVRLFRFYERRVQEGTLDEIWPLLLNHPVEESFAKKFPVYDGVCMGNKKACTCGAPFNF